MAVKKGKQTPDMRRRIDRHNWRCRFSAGLYLVGGLVNAGVAFLLGVAISSFFSGTQSWAQTGILGWLMGFLVMGGFIFWGWSRIKKKGEGSWMEVLGDVEPSARIAKLMTHKMGGQMMGAGSGMSALFLVGAEWFVKAKKKWKMQVKNQKETCRALGDFLRHLSARDSWEPVKDFLSHREEIENLARLKLIAIREHEGAWCLRVTLDAEKMMRGTKSVP